MPYDPADSQSDNQLGTPPGSNSEATPGQDEEEVAHTVGSGPSIYDIFLVCAIIVMLICHWIFFGVVWAKKGIEMSNHVAKVVTEKPHATTYFITLIGIISSMIVSTLFSFAVGRFCQELVAHRPPIQPFYLAVLSGFRDQTWPWKSVKETKNLLTPDRWWPASLVIACLLTLPQLTSSTTSLITPVSFNRTAILTATELDFSSGDADCLAWFAAHPPSNNCNYQLYNGQYYSGCVGENQMVDVLAAGRGKMLELTSNKSQTLSFSELGAQDGLQFQGSIRGILPIGPNGFPAFEPPPFSNLEIIEGTKPYNYTLNLQGLTSNVSCKYESTSPLVYEALAPGSNVALAYNASCATMGQTEVLMNVASLFSVNSNDTLTYWACQSAPNGTQPTFYSIYLRGTGYESGIGNITCTLNQIQPAIFPVTYQSTAGIFSTTPEPITSSPMAFSTLINYALTGLAGVITRAQNFESNLVADSVIAYVVKSFRQDPRQQTSQYLRLYEQMIQGMIEYETTYIRLIYTTVSDPLNPSPCNRLVTGSLSYEVIGWFVTSANIGFLIPMTIINGAALVALSLAVISAKTGGDPLHPFHARPVAIHPEADPREEVPDEWEREVSLSLRKVEKKYISSKEEDQRTSDAQEVTTALLNGARDDP